MTQVLDHEQIAEWSGQQPQRPWTKKPARLQAWIAVAALLPSALVALIFTYTEIPGPILLVAVFFPLQLLAAGIAAGRNERPTGGGRFGDHRSFRRRDALQFCHSDVRARILNRSRHRGPLG